MPILRIDVKKGIPIRKQKTRSLFHVESAVLTKHGLDDETVVMEVPENSRPELPRHYELTFEQYLFSALSLAAAFGLLAWNGIRIAAGLDLLQWWVPVVLLAGIAMADFGSGMIHWTADTWGRDDLPLIGQRLLVPFRVHHVNPDDFLRRSFIDTNGDVAFVLVPFLAGALFIPLESAWGGPLAVSLFGFSAIGIITNQTHQWAHMPVPPAPVRVLQDWGVILRGAEHDCHHRQPFDGTYCIATGWWNRPLDAIGFFRRLERVVTAVTGIAPREDDSMQLSRYGDPKDAKATNA